METVSKILLSESASKHLLEAGECWMIAGKSSEQPGRVVIHMMPLDMATATAACEVALGVRKPGKRIITPPAPAEAVTELSDATTDQPRKLT